MTPTDNEKKENSISLQTTASTLVTRSSVPSGRNYNDYKEYLRFDFFYSCAYCTMSEAEAQAIRFVIDHYEPRRARPDLIDEYSNLIYSCDECNTRKGDRYPPSDARVDGHRFFRPDQDAYEDHFRVSGIRLEPKSNVGDYSIDALDLNRWLLRRLRDIRQRLAKCHPLVVGGILALRKFKIDQLPPTIRGRAAHTINDARAMANQLAENIDTLLREHARSELIDPDPEAGIRARERQAKLKRLQSLYQGAWRGRDVEQS